MFDADSKIVELVIGCCDNSSYRQRVLRAITFISLVIVTILMISAFFMGKFENIVTYINITATILFTVLYYIVRYKVNENVGAILFLVFSLIIADSIWLLLGSLNEIQIIILLVLSTFYTLIFSKKYFWLLIGMSIVNLVILIILSENTDLANVYANGYNEISNLIIISVVAILVLNLTIHYHILLHNKKLEEIDAQNENLLFAKDTLERKNKELLLLNNKLKEEEELSRSAMDAKSNFLSVMSHEIRTPLNAIIGFAGFIKETKTDEAEIRNSVKNIYFSSQHLLLLVNDILDFNKIDEGKLKLKNMPFNLRRVFSMLESMYRGVIEEKGLELNFDISPKVDEQLFFGDETRINQVLINLLSNAAKFTSNGSISLLCSVSSEDKEFWTLNIKISDTGVGISESNLNKIFNRFTQVDSNVSRKYQGSGLGLTITKKLIELFGSEIKVESVEGKGSTFSFDLILGLVKEELTDNLEDIDSIEVLKGKTVLVADDNVFNRAVTKNFLKRWGVEVVEVENGREAFDYILSNNPCDIILMDLHMPEMDGFEATRFIRKLNNLMKSQIPIIALTADVMQETIVKVKEFGMNDYVSKPFKPDELKRKILKYSILNLQNLNRIQ